MVMIPENSYRSAFGSSHSTIPVSLDRSDTVLYRFVKFAENFFFKFVSPSRFAVVIEQLPSKWLELNSTRSHGISSSSRTCMISPKRMSLDCILLSSLPLDTNGNNLEFVRLSALCLSQSSYPCLIAVTQTTNDNGTKHVAGLTGLSMNNCMWDCFLFVCTKSDDNL